MKHFGPYIMENMPDSFSNVILKNMEKKDSATMKEAIS